MAKKRKEAWEDSKPRKQTYASLKRKADGVFSEWIRRSNANSEGWVNCATCDAGPYTWQRIQCGHFVSRVHLSTRWDERNCAPQCFACNVWKRGSPAEFALWLSWKYGSSILQELVDKKRQQVKWTKSDLESMIASYKAKLHDLETISIVDQGIEEYGPALRKLAQS